MILKSFPSLYITEAYMKAPAHITPSLSDTIQPARPRRLIRKERLTLTEKPYRGDVDGSEKDFFFNYHGGSERLYVFEAPIDMLSFITLNKREGWQKHSYLALGCTAPLALLRFLSEYLGIHQIVLCMDNDAAGIKADAIIQETLHRLSQGMYVEDLSEETREQLQRPYEVSILKSIKKDWNDDLKYG
ncbi:toprim domain-containing protein [Caproiciproducens sp. CPB-2]|nr:toprim domain-containing protein [Caproiciproducens sp. CPB-2]MDF1493942.1 toprim domain-containing protein [Caproiciproducens sp. CPB-2]